MTDIISIDKYISEYDSTGPHFYAIKGKNRYPIPNEFKDMCNDNYLAISKTSSPMPGVITNEEGEFWIPRMTNLQ